MEQIFAKGYLSKFKIDPEIRREAAALPIRPRGKKTRLWIDNEYFTERYGEVLPLSAFAVLAVLCKYANSKTQACWPSAATIAREAVLNPKTVFSCLKKLEHYRLIDISRSKGGSSNRYTLLDNRVWLKPNRVKSSGEPSNFLPPTV
jgi:hypothetical protein